ARVVGAIIRKLPIGAEVQRAGGVHFRVWAPRARHAAVRIEDASFPLEPEDNGYYSGMVEAASAGTHYKFALNHGIFPDPASRFQPQGPHGPSEVVDASRFVWRDQQWRGLRKEDVVLYEMHVGTFTAEGTWAAAQKELPELRNLGITTLEIMPVAEFSGKFGWGY